MNISPASSASSGIVSVSPHLSEHEAFKSTYKPVADKIRHLVFNKFNVNFYRETVPLSDTFSVMGIRVVVSRQKTNYNTILQDLRALVVPSFCDKKAPDALYKTVKYLVKRLK